MIIVTFRCENVKDTFAQIYAMLTILIDEATTVARVVDSTVTDREKLEKLEMDRHEFQEARKTIAELKAHQMRAAYSSKVRAAIVTTLKEDRCLITMDFAQKWLPRRWSETQADYFGRRGLR